MTNGLSTSCGCLFREMHTKHGHAGTKKHMLYGIWTGLRQRCNNPETKDYYRYGGLGIKVCARWDSFASFLDDMASGFGRGLSIDRINTHGDYSPDNCRWATKREQARNRGDNLYLELNGVRRLMLDWPPIVGVSYATLWQRKKAGWDDARALTTPVRSSQ